MVTYLPYFHEISDFQRYSANIKNSLIHYCISWSTKKNACNIYRIFMEQLGNILIFNIRWTLFRSIPPNFIGNFFRIFREYVMGMFHKYSTNNIPVTLFGNIPRNFMENFFRIFWEYIMGMKELNQKCRFVLGMEYDIWVCAMISELIMWSVIIK